MIDECTRPGRVWPLRVIAACLHSPDGAPAPARWRVSSGRSISCQLKLEKVNFLYDQKQVLEKFV